MTADSGVHAWLLARQLRRAREAADLTTRELAPMVGRQSAWVSKVETGALIPSPELTRMWAAACKLPQVDADGLAAWAQAAARPGDTTWWAGIPSVSLRGYTELESDASKYSSADAGLIPGILQTPEYTRAVEKALGVADDLIDASVVVRQKRQQRIPSLQVHAVICESALTRNIGNPDVMRGQRSRIVRDVESGNIVVQVHPLNTGFFAGIVGRVTVLDFTGALPSVAWTDTLAGSLVVEDRQDVARIKNFVDQAQKSALSPAESLRMIKEMR